MKITALLLVIFALAGGRALAQRQGLAAASPAVAAEAGGFDERLSALLVQSTPATGHEVVVSKHLRVSGPLVRPFKGTRLLELPRRFLHLINPFARTESKEERRGIRELSPRAWTTVVGWHPGQSAFPDALSHEPSVGLISLSRP